MTYTPIRHSHPTPPSRCVVLPSQLKEQLSQSHDKDSDLPTPLMFAAASSSLDSRSLNPLLSELLGCMCDIDEARRQRWAPSLWGLIVIDGRRDDGVVVDVDALLLVVVAVVMMMASLMLMCCC